VTELLPVWCDVHDRQMVRDDPGQRWTCPDEINPGVPCDVTLDYTEQYRLSRAEGGTMIQVIR
jgi:hypothetical protein